MMGNVLETLTWEYAGFFKADPNDGKYEIWFLLTAKGEHVARFLRYNKEFIENHKEFLETKQSWHSGPQFSYHQWFRDALPWDNIQSQLDGGKVLFALSDSGINSVEFCDVCTLDPVDEIKKEMSLFDEIIQAIGQGNDGRI